MGCCSAGDDDDAAAAASGAGVGGLLVVSANSAVILTLSAGVLLLSLLRVGTGRADPSGVGGSGAVGCRSGGCITETGPTLADDGPAEALRPLRVAGAGATIVGTTPPLPWLLDLAAGVGSAGGADAGRWGLDGLRLRDLDFDFAFGVAGAGVAGAGVAGGPTGSGCLLLDLAGLAGLADAARFGSNLGAAGAGSILGVWSPPASERLILFNAASLLSLALIGSMPAGGGGA